MLYLYQNLLIYRMKYYAASKRTHRHRHPFQHLSQCYILKSFGLWKEDMQTAKHSWEGGSLLWSPRRERLWARV